MRCAALINGGSAVLRRLACLVGVHRWRQLSQFYVVDSGVAWTRYECRCCGLREARR